MSQPQVVTSIPSDRAIMTMLAIKEKKSMQEIAAILGLSLGMVQRYFSFLKELEYIERPVYPGSRKAVSRGTRVTDAGAKMLRLHGHTL